MRVQYFLLSVVACYWSEDKFMKTVEKIALAESTVPKASVVACSQFHKALGKGNCYVFNTQGSESYISPLRALYLLVTNFEEASTELSDKKFDNIQVVMKKDPKCRVVVNDPKDLGAEQITGSITISEDSAKETEKGWGVDSSMSYSTPGSFIAGVTVSVSAEYHKSIVTSASNSVGQTFKVEDGIPCTPSIVRYSILCEPAAKVFYFNISGHYVTFFKDKDSTGIFLPLSNNEPKFFSSSVGCISRPMMRK